jgi:hypothetical protein
MRQQKNTLHIQTRDPALLLRAAVIDQAASDLVTEATAKPTAATAASPTLPPGSPPAHVNRPDFRHEWPAKTPPEQHAPSNIPAQSHRHCRDGRPVGP